VRAPSRTAITISSTLSAKCLTASGRTARASALGSLGSCRLAVMGFSGVPSRHQVTTNRATSLTRPAQVFHLVCGATVGGVVSSPKCGDRKFGAGPSFAHS
jgi:hypothetical protein